MQRARTSVGAAGTPLRSCAAGALRRVLAPIIWVKARITLPDTPTAARTVRLQTLRHGRARVRAG